MLLSVNVLGLCLVELKNCLDLVLIVLFATFSKPRFTTDFKAESLISTWLLFKLLVLSVARNKFFSGGSGLSLGLGRKPPISEFKI